MTTSAPAGGSGDPDRRQRIVADLGERALSADGVDEVLRDASATVADALDVEYSAVLALEPGGDELTLREGVGWPEGAAGETTVPAGDGSQAGYALQTDGAVAVAEFGTETRFDASGLVAASDAVSGLSVPVATADGPWGALAVHATDRREFAESDRSFLRCVSNVVGSAVANGRPDGRRREKDRDRVYRALETTSEGVSLLDENGEFAYVNPAYADLYGYDPDEMIGEHWEMLYPEGESDEIYDEVLPTLAEEGVWSDETTGLRSDGTTFVEDHRLAKTADGGMVCTVRDASEARKHRRRLERQEAALRETYEVISDGTLSFEEKVDAMLGIGRDVVGTDYASLSNVDGEDYEFEVVHAPDDSVQAGDVVPLSSTVCERAITTEETVVLADVATEAPELLDRADDADWGVSCYLGAPVFLDGRVYGTFCFYDEDPRSEPFSDWETTFVDLLSRWISYELEREEHERVLAESNERLEQFAYAASHDLQEPLRMVTSYLQLLERRYGDAFDEDGEEFLAFAVDGADRMREMIDGLLEYSRIETEGEPLEPVDLNAVLEATVADLELMIEETGAEVTVGDLPRVQGDASQLRQVFQNLLSNGIEYSGEGVPRVEVTARRDGEDRVIDVSDDGIGIDPGDRGRIFEVFQRLHTNEEHAGTGIGLALCRRIVERHGGDIRVESTPGEGSTFSVRLPAADADER